jgi:hypothetical protein
MQKLLVLLFILLQTTLVCGQDQEPAEDRATVIEKYGPRRQISTIVYCGLAGAVLGLSTLSFYGRPQDKLTNIPIGFGLGVVVGTIYMTYQAATNPDEFYRETQIDYQPQFDGLQGGLQLAADLYFAKPQPQLGYQWDF